MGYVEIQNIKEIKLKVQAKSDDTKNSVGSGVVIVVWGWESQPRGEERQVVLLMAQERYA